MQMMVTMLLLVLQVLLQTHLPQELQLLTNDFSIMIISGEEGADPTISVEGSHDGFPAYEINITDKNGQTFQIYHDSTSGKWEIFRLLLDKDTEVD